MDNTGNINDLNSILIDFNFDAPEWVPKWVLLKVANKYDELLKDTVYNIYECGCFLLNKVDQKRRGRLKQYFINKKRINHIVCSCKFQGHFLCKVKICSGCDLIKIGTKQKDGMCKICNVGSTPITLLFFQNDKIYEDPPKNPTYTEPDCKYRSKCLHKIIPFDPTEFNVYLWCYKCPKFEDISDI